MTESGPTPLPDIQAAERHLNDGFEALRQKRLKEADDHFENVVNILAGHGLLFDAYQNFRKVGNLCDRFYTLSAPDLVLKAIAADNPEHLLFNTLSMISNEKFPKDSLHVLFTTVFDLRNELFDKGVLDSETPQMMTLNILISYYARNLDAACYYHAKLRRLYPDYTEFDSWGGLNEVKAYEHGLGDMLEDAKLDISTLWETAQAFFKQEKYVEFDSLANFINNVNFLAFDSLLPAKVCRQMLSELDIEGKETLLRTTQDTHQGLYETKEKHHGTFLGYNCALVYDIHTRFLRDVNQAILALVRDKFASTPGNETLSIVDFGYYPGNILQQLNDTPIDKKVRYTMVEADGLLAENLREEYGPDNTVGASVYDAKAIESKLAHLGESDIAIFMGVLGGLDEETLARLLGALRPYVRHVIVADDFANTSRGSVIVRHSRGDIVKRMMHDYPEIFSKNGYRLLDTAFPPRPARYCNAIQLFAS